MIELANKIIQILSTEGKEETLASTIESESKRIPFLHQFPTACCEEISYLFAMSAKKASPVSKVELVSGSVEGIQHYWVTINELIYDLTAHQFPGIKSPKLGVNTNDISGLKVDDTEDIFIKFGAWDRRHKDCWLAFVQDKL